MNYLIIGVIWHIYTYIVHIPYKLIYVYICLCIINLMFIDMVIQSMKKNKRLWLKSSYPHSILWFYFQGVTMETVTFVYFLVTTTYKYIFMPHLYLMIYNYKHKNIYLCVCAHVSFLAAHVFILTKATISEA